ncbi:MAG TPA: SDR family oxidoreductase [Leptolyngbya sp.]|jgi:NAD(P)-dependent dehydrogenase (short-subunit alcohol dehydrogenase family)|nr:SDR family oxidoreductase [Leptolyngbya sp.]
MKPKTEVVVITGASAGIGRATAQAFAKEGACIGLVARSREGLEAAKKEVEAIGGHALVLPTDVSDPEQVEAAAAAVEATFGSIDIWVNNAMASILSPFTEIEPDDFRRVTEVTYLGYVYGTMAALKRMKPRNRGTIVQVGSALAYRSIPLQAAYCGAKSAIRGFTDSIRCELLHDKSDVHITMVQMPAVNTPQFGWIQTSMPHQPQPVPPIFQPEVAADAIVWSAHHTRRELYVGGSTVEAILGNKIAPGLVDLYLAKTGYSGQQTDQPIAPDRANNLWEPVPHGNYQAHGQFDDRAQDGSLELWAAKNQDWITLAVGVGVAGIAIGALLGTSQSKPSAKEDEVTESEIRQRTYQQLHQDVNQGNTLDRFHLLSALAHWGWKTISKTIDQTFGKTASETDRQPPSEPKPMN